MVTPSFCWIHKHLLQKTMFTDHQEAPKLLEIEGVSSSWPHAVRAQRASVLGSWEPSFYVVQYYFRHLDEGKSIWQRQGEEKGALELGAGVPVYATHRGQTTLGAWEHTAVYIALGRSHGQLGPIRTLYPSDCLPSKISFSKGRPVLPLHLHVAISSWMRLMSRAKGMISKGFWLCNFVQTFPKLPPLLPGHPGCQAETKIPPVGWCRFYSIDWWKCLFSWYRDKRGRSLDRKLLTLIGWWPLGFSNYLASCPSTVMFG